MVNLDEPVFRDALFRNKKKKSGLRVVEAPDPPLEALVADTHAHLDMLPDVPLTLARCAVHHLGFICSIVDVYEDGRKAYLFSEAWQEEARKILPEIVEARSDEKEEVIPADIPRIRIAAGCHPHNAKHYNNELEVDLIDLMRDQRTCAIGEVGLDYHYDLSPREQQKEAFRRQIRLAHLSGLPLILHLREAHEDALTIMDEEGFPPAGVLLHCFNLDFETLVPWLDRGCFVAFGGPLTFKKSDDVRAAAAGVPLKRLLTETDAPFMTPEPMRGMLCGPEHAIFTAAKLAQVYDCPPGEERKEFLEALYRNALDLLDRRPSAWQLKR